MYIQATKYSLQMTAPQGILQVPNLVPRYTLKVSCTYVLEHCISAKICFVSWLSPLSPFPSLPSTNYVLWEERHVSPNVVCLYTSMY